MVDADDGRLKRLGMFFSEEKLERAKAIAANFRKKREELDAQALSGSGAQAKRREDDSSSSSGSDTLLENLTEDSRYSSLDSFQAVVRDKLADVKVSKHN